MNLKTLFILIRSIVYVPLFILFFGWIALQVKDYDPKIGTTLPQSVRVPGIVLMALGGLLVLICVGVFIIRGKGTPAVFDPPTEFVAAGPYAYVRNPMYLGGFLLLLGFAFYHCSVAMLIYLLLLSLVFHLFVIYVEEPTLAKKFGKSYLDYKKTIHRWIPKVKSYGKTI